MISETGTEERRVGATVQEAVAAAGPVLVTILPCYTAASFGYDWPVLELVMVM